MNTLAFTYIPGDKSAGSELSKEQLTARNQVQQDQMKIQKAAMATNSSTRISSDSNQSRRCPRDSTSWRQPMAAESARKPVQSRLTRAPSVSHVPALDRSLILYAEHEFNASTFTARVIAVGDTINSETRRVTVRLEVDNRDGHLKPHMFATVRIASMDSQEVVVIPSAAVQSLNQRSVVFVEQAQRRLHTPTLGRRLVRNALERREWRHADPEQPNHHHQPQSTPWVQHQL